ncbi:hypothetical protein BDM02DRAFT_3185730 [Thelephora ganbajun]|uniref:Uncharacterized protein n=1 Tax=Thelephora ganbajun TaxID=370292 RepID=A0ACB6ZKG7_THEGA|nr:hypothetical protein BDM02DRAFT_3185730 [Thelephora ganbajun]
MSGPTYYEVVEPATPITPTSTSRHRPGLSITTNASGIADSTISYGTVDALQSQLGHFPSPPSELPTPTTPKFPTFLIPVVPLKLPQRNPHPDVPSESSRPLPSLPPPIHYPPEEPVLQNGVLRQLRRRPSFKTYATNGTVGSLSPFDWHEGSSSIDVDPHDNRMLPTSFITSLISSSEHGSPRSNPAPMSPPQSSAQLFSGGNNFDTTSSVSDATYPPCNYPPPSSPNMVIPPGAAYLESSGRSSKTSSMGARTSDTDHDKPSVGSHTPLVNHANRYEPIKEDTIGELQARGEASKHLTGVGPSRRSSRGRRQSLLSTRTTKSYVSSLISKLSRATSRKQPITKPLPPVPAIPSQLRNSDYQKFEESMPLPQLVNRAEVLSRMLAKGQRPDSDYSPSNAYRSTPTPVVEVTWNGIAQTLEASKSNWSTIPEVPSYEYHSEGRMATSNRPVGFWERLITRFGKKRIIAMFIVIAVLLIILIVLLGVLLRKKSVSVLPKCPAGKTGTDCDIAASCVCIGGSSSTCVAQGLLDMLPATNSAFNTNFTTQDVATSLFDAMGVPPDNNCAYQAILVDAGSKLRVGAFPVRTSWARSALLWHLIQTTDTSAISYIRAFLEKADFSALGSDSAVDKSGYQIASSGFVFDFAKMAIRIESVSWKSDAQPSGDEVSKVKDTLSAALDKMYSNALAGSTQRQTALTKYWKSSLGQKPEDLSRFLAIIAGSRIMVPFDGTASVAHRKIVDLMPNATNFLSFPPPLACYPGLDASSITQVNQIEQQIFSLSVASTQSGFDTDCFDTRPIYGRLDLLQLRLPFYDSRRNASRQGVMLERSVNSRAVVYSGEYLSPLPSTSSPSSSPNSLKFNPNPLQYGTTNHLNHVILQYLKSIPNINIAIAFARFVLSSVATPPAVDSALYNALDQMPTLEVALFGSIAPSDVSFIASSFATPSDGLFFGSDEALRVRSYAINTTRTSVVWTEQAGSPRVVRDSSFDDQAFNSVWDPAFAYMHLNNSGEQQSLNVNVKNITSAFGAIGKFVA